MVTASFNPSACKSVSGPRWRSKLCETKSDSRVGIVVAREDSSTAHPAAPPSRREYRRFVAAGALRHAVKGVVFGALLSRAEAFRVGKAIPPRGATPAEQSRSPSCVLSLTTAAPAYNYISVFGRANQIFASPTTLKGSIGVFSVIPTFQRTLEKFGVKIAAIATTSGGRRTCS